MVRTASFVLMLLTALPMGGAAAQEVMDIVSVDPANRSAMRDVTWSIAGYIARQNDSTIVQVLSRPQPGMGRAMGLSELLNAIETGDALRQDAGPAPVVVAPAAQAAPPVARSTTPPRRVLRDRNPFGGGGDGAGGGGGGGW